MHYKTNFWNFLGLTLQIGDIFFNVQLKRKFHIGAIHKPRGQVTGGGGGGV